MSSMDLKFKGITWVEDICQKFESMCHEVDNIMNLDTVKYVENQVQTVGGNVRKFYSGVVNEFIPPSMHPIKHKTQSVIPKRNAADVICTETIIGVEENPIDTVSKQLHVDWTPSDAVKNQLGHGISGELQPIINQGITPISGDSLHSAKSDSTPWQLHDTKTEEKSDMTTENIAMKEKSPAPEVLQLTISEEKACSSASSFNEFIDSNLENTWELQAEESPVTSIHGEEFPSPQKEGTVYDDFADVCDSSEMNFSVLPCEKKIAEMGLVSSISSLSLESCTSFENLLEDDPTKAMSCNDPVDEAWSVSESPNALHHFTSASEVPCKNNVAENGLLTPSSVLPLESSGPLDECYNDTNDSEMETIDLCDNVKLEDSCIFTDDSELHAVSRRTQKLRSYKKKILDAFSSRKRLAKEYEQIAIWYGDVDVGSRQDTSYTLVPPTTSITSGSENSGMHHISDWELL